MPTLVARIGIPGSAGRSIGSGRFEERFIRTRHNAHATARLCPEEDIVASSARPVATHRVGASGALYLIVAITTTYGIGVVAPVHPIGPEKPPHVVGSLAAEHLVIVFIADHRV